MKRSFMTNLPDKSGAFLQASRIILAYGGDEGVDGAAVLVLPKEDLKAFAAVRGKTVKEIVG